MMCSITAGGKRLHNVFMQIGSTSGIRGIRKSLFTYNGENDVHLFSISFNPILFILTSKEDMYKVSAEFEF